MKVTFQMNTFIIANELRNVLYINISDNSSESLNSSWCNHSRFEDNHNLSLDSRKLYQFKSTNIYDVVATSVRASTSVYGTEDCGFEPLLP